MRHSRKGKGCSRGGTRGGESTEEKDLLLKKTQEMVAGESELRTSVDSLKKEMALM